MRLLKFALTRLHSERGQSLILAAFAMVVLLGFAAMSIDVGYWYSQKREVQKAVDAAALAGARELPDDYMLAESKAREYLAKNGITDEDTISITFRCTSTYQIACNPAANKWDSIVIEVERPADAWFARVFGIQEALVRDVRAVGCSGPCGGSPFVPVDVVQILDRTTSMDDGDMAKARDGARALLEYFLGDIQRVGLAVLPASQTWENPCPAPGVGNDSWTVWLPVNLSDDYQSSPHVLNEGSRLVSTINCLQAGGATDLGDPMAAAISELQTNGRADVKWGIILLTDGVANRPIANTGYLSPSANAAAPGGDNNGFQTNPTYAYADDSSRAEDPSSGTDTNTGCGDAGKDRHDFYNYGISVPGTNTVVGIEVRLDAWMNSTSYAYTRRMCVQLSWDGGVTWTAAKQTNSLSTMQQQLIVGNSADTWGHTWTPDELNNNNFRVRVTNVADRTDKTFYLDWAAVRVYHLKNGGPCAYAAAQADIARAAGIEVFTIGYGMHDPTNPGGIVCSEDKGSWKDVYGWELLEYMATDSDHFFDEPTTADLRPIFEVIGSKLASGSKLVE